MKSDIDKNTATKEESSFDERLKLVIRELQDDIFKNVSEEHKKEIRKVSSRSMKKYHEHMSAYK